jgi:hypothetical protein
MAQVTALSPLGTPGLPYAFIAKVPVLAYTLVGRTFLYTAANWGAVAFYFEAFLRATVGTVRARLYNTTDSAVVASSEVTTANAVFNRQRSADISGNLVDGKEYRAQTSPGEGGAGEIHSAVVVVV